MDDSDVADRLGRTPTPPIDPRERGSESAERTTPPPRLGEGQERAVGPSEERAREARSQARSWVYERLALLSAAIWVIGTFLLFVTTVPFVPRPQLNIAVAMTLPLVPAALPWLLYKRLAELRARRLLQDEVLRKEL